jgi:anti-anti-sigma factor
MGVVQAEASGIRVVSFEGEEALDAPAAPRLERDLRAALGGSATAVVDLGGVGFIDSAGLRVLVSVVRAARSAGRRLVLARAGQAVRMAMEAIRLDEVLELHADVESASEALRAR